MTFAVVPVHTESDWQRVAPLSRALQAFEQSIRPQRKAVDNIATGALRYIREQIAAHDGTCFLAQNDNGQAIGFIAGWVVLGDGLDKGDNRLGEIVDVFVDPAHRRSGVFQSLLQHMTTHFAGLGVQNLTLSTLAANGDMQQVLKRCGFTQHRLVYERPIKD